MAQNKLLLIQGIATAGEMVAIGRRTLRSYEARRDQLILQYVSDPGLRMKEVLVDDGGDPPVPQEMRKIVTVDGRTYFWDARLALLYVGPANRKRTDRDGRNKTVVTLSRDKEAFDAIAKGLARQLRRR